MIKERGAEEEKKNLIRDQEEELLKEKLERPQTMQSSNPLVWPPPDKKKLRDQNFQSELERKRALLEARRNFKRR